LTSNAHFSLSVWNAEGEQIDRQSKLTVWDAVAQAQAAQDRGWMAKVTPMVPEKVQLRTRRRKI
jgi:hypothetical protein